MKSIHIRVQGIEGCHEDKRMANCFWHIIESCNLHVRNTASHYFYPHGLSILVVLSESDAGMSTYPERKEAQIDFMSCQENSTEKIMEFLEEVKKAFINTSVSYIAIDRSFINGITVLGRAKTV